KENYKDEVAVVEEWLGKRKLFRIGETGLESCWETTYKSQQIDALETQIRCAEERGLPVIIHSRNAMDDCIDLIEKHQDGTLKGVFHCFSGSVEQGKRIMALDFFMGIGGVITYKKSGLAEVMAELPLDKV